MPWFVVVGQVNEYDNSDKSKNFRNINLNHNAFV